ncbi:ribosomal maturation YjgA family protein [Spirosoma daeguense]
MPKSLVTRGRLVYGLLTVTTLLIGFASRRFFGDCAFVRMYVGDVLWALMVFFGFAFVFRKWPTWVVAVATLAFSFFIEISQLYHAPWIDEIRAMPLGGLILGFTFVWSDLLCYSLGVGVGVLVETYITQPTAEVVFKQ